MHAFPKYTNHLLMLQCRKACLCGGRLLGLLRKSDSKIMFREGWCLRTRDRAAYMELMALKETNFTELQNIPSWKGLTRIIITTPEWRVHTGMEPTALVLSTPGPEQHIWATIWSGAGFQKVQEAGWEHSTAQHCASGGLCTLHHSAWNSPISQPL